ncbi:MAG: YciI family protein [Rhodospirillaceae bacterium]|nr:YciI family protein [Rhodospirillaceae bacterium]
MLCTIIAFDKPGHLDLRMKTRPAHLEWMERENVKATFIGPILADDGTTPIGSLFVADFDSLAAAKAFHARDPYSQAGLFDRVTVQPTRQVYPK